MSSRASQFEEMISFFQLDQLAHNTQPAPPNDIKYSAFSAPSHLALQGAK
ncbi:hypothetical protein WAE56_18505 [Iodobacter sp. LRB]|nr:hypothetical protein [Iodobacter sp. BJB302]